MFVYKSNKRALRVNVSKNQTSVYDRYHITWIVSNQILRCKSYSHSIVAGGFELMSYTTRLIPFTLLIISLEMADKNS